MEKYREHLGEHFDKVQQEVEAGGSVRNIQGRVALKKKDGSLWYYYRGIEIERLQRQCFRTRYGHNIRCHKTLGALTSRVDRFLAEQEGPYS